MKKYILSFMILLVYNKIHPQVTDQNDWRIFQSSIHQSEPFIAINKRFENIILVSANVLNSYGQGYYYSLDYGQNWTGADNLPNSPQDIGGDPVTAFDANGDFHIATMIKNEDDEFDGYYLFSTSDPTLTWVKKRGFGPQVGFDKEMMVFFDDQQNSPYQNYFYCAWTQFDVNGQTPEDRTRILFNRSTDQLASFSSSVRLGTQVGYGTSVKTGPNGEVYVCWAGSIPGIVFPDHLGFAFSDDGGVNFDVGIPFSYDGIRTASKFGKTRINAYPSMAVDRSCGPFKGRIYVAYAEQDDDGDGFIGLRYSDDHGGTFSDPPFIISDDANVEQAFFPVAACDPVTGIVVVAFHGLDNHSDGTNTTNTYVSFSNDGGLNFTNLKVSDQSHNRQAIPGTAGIYAGDYIGIDIYNGRVYTAWADPRANGIWQIYVSPLDLRVLSDRILSIPGDLNFSNMTFDEPNIVYKANNISISGNSQITSSGSITLISNNSIQLSPDFISQIEGELHTIIDPSIEACQTPGFVPNRSSQFFDQSQNSSRNQIENKDDIFALYPNPSDGYITLASSIESFNHISVLNFFGNKLLDFDFLEEKQKVKLDIQSLKPGPYFVKITTSKNEIVSLKFIMK